MKIRKIINSLLVLAFMLAVLGLAAVLIKRAEERPVEYTGLTIVSIGTETVTTYNFKDGALIGRVSALGVGAHDNMHNSLQGSFNTSLANRRHRAVTIRDIKAVIRSTGRTLGEFGISFEQAAIAPGQQYAFSGTVPVSSDFFNTLIRKYDLALKLVTDMGALELPLEVYSLEVEPAVAAGLLTTNEVSLDESEGIINFLNCERTSPELCEEMLERMGLQR